MQGQYSFLQQDPRFLQQQQASAQPQGGSNPLQPQQTGYLQSQPTGYVPPQQTGYVPPQQTGYVPPQQTGYMASQPTGYIQQQPTGYVQPQMTGFATGGMMRAQPTGFRMQPQQTGYVNNPTLSAGMPPMPALPSQFQGQQQQHLGLPNSNPTLNSRFSTGLNPMASSLTAQPTGYGMGFSGQMPALGASSQPFLNTFMPAPGVSQPSMYGTSNFQPSQMQFAQQPNQFNGMSLQQTFQQQNQQQIGQSQVKVPWKLSTEEKKSYDQIFRAWDQAGTGFIEGKMSTEVFAQSGLGREDLMQIWGLADVENRGKLNLAEFHVAMGLIYRRLNGNPIPATLPPEMVPPSARDLDNSVDFLKDLLKKDNARSTGESYAQHTLGPVRSLHAPKSSPNLRKDATMYKHDEYDGSSTYKSRSRHIDRRSVRHAGEDKTEAGLDDLKRELDRTDSMMESSRRQDEDDEGLDQELEDLKYRIRRIQDDIEHIARSGRRSDAKDDERRQLERDLLRLRHDDLPDLERRIEDRDRERRREANRYARERDSRNNRSRFDDNSNSGNDRDDYHRRDQPDRGYMKGSYDSERAPRDFSSRNSFREPSSRSSIYDDQPGRDRDDHDRQSNRHDSPAPRPPSAPALQSKPISSPSTATKTMTAEEKKAFIQAEAQRRIQDRLRSLGIGGTTVSTPAAADPEINARLEQEKQEAAIQASKADVEAEAREKQRQIRLEEERLNRIRAEEELNSKTADTIQNKKQSIPTTQPATSSSSSLNAAVVSEEEVELKRREEALAKEKAARLARIKQLEEEEEESHRLEEEFQRKKAMFASRAAVSSTAVKKAPPPPPISRSRMAPPTVAPTLPPAPPAAPPPPPVSEPASTDSTNPVRQAPELVESSKVSTSTPPASQAALPPPAPPAPPAPVSASTNPFHRFNPPADDKPDSTPALTFTPAGSGPNPFFKPTSVAQPVSQPATTSSQAYRPPPRPKDSDDEWDAVKEKDDDDSDSDDEGATTARQAREGLAAALFGGGISRPVSAAGDKNAVSPGSTIPVAPPAPPAAPRAPALIVQSNGPADRGMLLGEIQSGKRLRKAQTNDRSGSALAGKVLGDNSPPPPPTSSSRGNEESRPIESVQDKRLSVDWFGGMASDGMHALPSPSHQPSLESHTEEPSADEVANGPGIESRAEHATDEFDMDLVVRVRTLYQYQPQRPEDLALEENLVVSAHPSKTDGDWWYGTLETTGQSGTFPRLYVEELKISWGKALYSYAASGPDEVSLIENSQIPVVDTSDPDWFKVEDQGRIGIAPGAYIEIGVSASVVEQDTPISIDTSSTQMEPFPGQVGHAHHWLPRPDESSESSGDSSHTLEIILPTAGRTTPGSNLLSPLSSSTSSTSMQTSRRASGAYSDDGSELEEDHNEVVRRQEIERYRILAAAGLVRKPTRPPPPLPPPPRPLRSHPRPISHYPSTTNDGLQPPEQISTPAPRRTPRIDISPIDVPEEVISHTGNGEEEVLMDEEKMQDALTRYLRSQRELPPLPIEDELLPSHQQVTKKVTTRPSSLSMSFVKSDQSSGSSSSSNPSGSLGFRAWMSEISKSVVGSNSNHHTLVDQRRRRISVSGPVPSSPPLSSGTTASFGSSWSSLMDSEALEKFTDREKNRQEAIFELIKTETVFVQNCQLLTEVFHRKLSPMLGSRASMIIFANIEEIMMFGVTFLSSLEERQMDDKLLVRSIGDVIYNHMQHVDVYRPYCTNQANAAKVLNDLKTRSDQIRDGLQSLKIKGLGLEHYLLEPMQRLTRYPLLIKQIIKYTDPSSADYNILQAALKKAEMVLTVTNEAIREQENELRLAALSENLWIPNSDARLDLTTPTRFVGRRRLIRDGQVSKPRSRKTYHAYLCSDFFLLTILSGPSSSTPIEQPQTMYRAPMPLEECHLEPPGRDESSLTLIHRSESITLKFPGGPKVCSTWRSDFNVARKLVFQALSAQRDKRASIPHHFSLISNDTSTHPKDHETRFRPRYHSIDHHQPSPRTQTYDRDGHYQAQDQPHLSTLVRSNALVGMKPSVIQMGNDSSSSSVIDETLEESFKNYRIGDQPPLLPPLPPTPCIDLNF